MKIKKILAAAAAAIAAVTMSLGAGCSPAPQVDPIDDN